jgi:hypothetical protein
MQPIATPHLWSLLRYQSDDYASYQADSEGGAPETRLTADQFAHLKTEDLRPILVDQYASENHVGGDDLVSLVDDVLAAQRDGYQILTWYGPDAEVLIAGVRPGARIG